MNTKCKLACFLFVPVITAGCDDAPYSTLEGPHAYINESLTASSKKIKVDADNGADATITVGLNEPAEQDATFRLVIDEEALNAYNDKESAAYLPLTTDNVDLPENITVAAGSYASDPVAIHIKPFSADMASEPYALPIRLESVDGVVATMSNSAKFIITTESDFKLRLPEWNGQAALVADGFSDGIALPNFTVECRFQVSNTSNRNRAVFTNGDDVLLRFEDPNSYDPNHPLHSLVQFQGDGWYMNPEDHFETNKWQHIALTWDGTNVTLYINGKSSGTKQGSAGTESNQINPVFSGCAWFGGDAGGHGTGDAKWWRNCKITCTELRIWSVCRTEAQIVNNMVTVSAKSKDLVAYWRMNREENTVSEFTDLTGNGHTLHANATPVAWFDFLSTDTASVWPQ